MARKSYAIPDNQQSMFDLVEDKAPYMPVLDVSRCEARIINYETAARMVETYHYAHRVPSIVVAIGMYVDGVLAGVCCYGSGANRNSSTFCPIVKSDVLELTRLFIHDWAGRNSESWLISQSFRFLDNIEALISYADTKYHHLGIVYQATNWLYTGLSDSSTVWIIGNSEYHSRSVYELYGTNELKKVRQISNKKVYTIKSKPKHRYVYFLGSKSQKKKLRKALKWPILPYPKG